MWNQDAFRFLLTEIRRECIALIEQIQGIKLLVSENQNKILIAWKRPDKRSRITDVECYVLEIHVYA